MAGLDAIFVARYFFFFWEGRGVCLAPPLWAAVLAAAALSGCAVLRLPGQAATAAGPAVGASAPASVFAAAASAPAAVSGAARAPGAAASAPAAAPANPSFPPFATVIRDAKKIAGGPMTLWQRDDKVWIELTPELLGQPFLLSPKLKSGIGEGSVLGGLMAYPVNGAGGQQVVEFTRLYNTVRLQARNTDVIATPGTPEARAVAAAFSPSLLGSTPVVSQPHPDTKAVLIEANGLFLTDMLGVGMLLQRNFRQGYGFDARNSVITGVRAGPAAVVIETQNHYYTGSLASAQGAPAAPPGAAPTIPRFLPDARSLLVAHHYSLSPLPAEPMKTRRADARVGLFASTVLDFGDDLSRSPRKRIVNRWRLEKKDLAAELSEPVKPITYWIDRNVPVAYRATVTEAILEWNKAFVPLGFKDAITVRQQPDDADFDTLDYGVASVRWMTNAEASFGAIGPRHIDPRSGEILDADIAVESLSSRGIRTVRSQLLAPRLGELAAGAPAVWMPSQHDHRTRDEQEFCAYGDVAAEQLGYALDVLEARGDVDPDSPQAQQFVLDYIKDTVMHEVGHTLGLRHNFRASRVYTEAQLADADFTRANGTAGSVMEYNAINLPRPGERGGSVFQTTLGPYDYWAIEYAYKPLPAGTTAADENTELLRIAARNTEPLLAFGTDEDNAFGLDPETIQLDLGADPIAFAAKRLDIARDLFQRQETRSLPPDRDWSVLRRSLGFALADVSRAVGVLMRQIGGVRTLRDFAGSGRDPLQPVDANTQRRALGLIASSVLSADSLKVSPALQRRLAPDFQDRSEVPGVLTDYVIAQRLLDLQRGVLGELMSEGLAARVVDSQGKAAQRRDAFQLSELYSRLNRDVWAEVWRSGPPGGEIDAARRELQREHINRMAGALLRPGPQARADARSLLRSDARALLARIESASHRKGLTHETRAHLNDSAESLRRALDAPLLRSGV